jgi:two-component system nitrogen regulation response regulator GlnG
VVLEVAGRIALLLHRRPAPGAGPVFTSGMIGESPAAEAVREAVARVAPLAVPVLVRGETGTGKELVARALHQGSPRARGPFFAVNLGALPPALAAAELFGARRGAYTGSVEEQPGYFARAEGGTLFLDEIGEAPAEVQVMLLRALETGEIVPVGAQKPRWVDVRIVSATDTDLEAAIAKGAFRAPLLHRLAGYSIHLAPLRERREDIGRLLAWFLRRELAELTDLGDTLPPADAGEPWLPVHLVSRLVHYAWPGNVRQLQNVVRQLVIDSRGHAVLRAARGLDELLPDPAAAVSLAAEPPPAEAGTPDPSSARMPRLRKPSEVSEDELRAALRANHWNLKATAAALGIARTSLYILLDQSPHARSASDIPPEEVRAAFARCDGDLEALAADLEISERALRQRLKDLGLR